ncbi:MAG TPA: LysR family transcriptional regulator [Longimicrobium sp.]|nr:LysR family transcriptional regulator [Longimicrobium sp.]
MPALNYRHLFYFWTVAREGSITRACKQLHVTQPAISTQLHKLEEQLGEPLFAKHGRGLALTDAGRVAFQYADEIFSLGRELSETLRGRPTGKPMRLTVGVTDAFPKLLAYRILAPALRMDPPVHLVLQDDRPERLFADLSIKEVDLVLTDAPLPPTAPIRAYNHLLGECGVTFFATPALAEAYAPGFPGSLHDAPMLLPAEGTTLRRSLVQWFGTVGVEPRIVAEVGDSALLKTFGQAGMGVFASPSAIEAEIRRQYGVAVVGRADEIRERFYAISVERKLKHPAVVALSESAREALFAPPRRRSRARAEPSPAGDEPADADAAPGTAAE